MKNPVGITEMREVRPVGAFKDTHKVHMSAPRVSCSPQTVLLFWCSFFFRNSSSSEPFKGCDMKVGWEDQEPQHFHLSHP